MIAYHVSSKQSQRCKVRKFAEAIFEIRETGVTGDMSEVIQSKNTKQNAYNEACDRITPWSVYSGERCTCIAVSIIHNPGNLGHHVGRYRLSNLQMSTQVFAPAIPCQGGHTSRCF